ncbi:aminopeptidase O isoform 4-T4 [Rhynchocyon petersi]
MDVKLNPSQDDLPLMANTSHMLVKHYVLDLDVEFENHVIEGTIVLFLESKNRLERGSSCSEKTFPFQSNNVHEFETPEPCHTSVRSTRTFSSKVEHNFAIYGTSGKDTSEKDGTHDNWEQASGTSGSECCSGTGNLGNQEFSLVLDCCDLSVLKVEEVDVAAVLGIEIFTKCPQFTVVPEELRNHIVHELVNMPADHWREQLNYFAQCSQAPGCGDLLFVVDPWSLQIRKTGVQTAADFPHAIRIWYRTNSEGRSVMWTTDQSGRCGSICSHMEYPCRFQNVSATTQDIIPHRVFAPVCIREICQKNLLQLIAPCLSAAHSVLGTHPFSRLDILIVPANFPSLGMASPHLIFLSQSTLTGRHLCGTRLCHEIAHSWFGLAIGALDWTEEWLSEGFATHLEDVFWAKTQQLAPLEAQEQQELRACLRWHRLQDEVCNSAEEMQVLRPNKEKTGHVTDSGASVIKHGLNPEKTFMQVHYLKGYFLLRFLAKSFGDETYFSFLRKFVHKFHGQLILSQDFLQMLLESIPEEKRFDLSVENIFQDWLESSGIPKPLNRERQTGTECALARQVDAEVAKWIRVNRRRRKRTRRVNEEVFAKLLPDQLVLLLERLLAQKTLHPRTLQSLQQIYLLPTQDAEVRHRWCELIVKHRYTAAYGQVESFLLEDQAMGIYLYGELMVSEDFQQQQLAHRCFTLTKEQMDRASAQVVAEMLF